MQVFLRRPKEMTEEEGVWKQNAERPDDTLKTNVASFLQLAGANLINEELWQAVIEKSYHFQLVLHNTLPLEDINQE